jgi:hypothetical protein
VIGGLHDVHTAPGELAVGVARADRAVRGGPHRLRRQTVRLLGRVSRRHTDRLIRDAEHNSSRLINPTTAVQAVLTGTLEALEAECAGELGLPVDVRMETMRNLLPLILILLAHLANQGRPDLFGHETFQRFRQAVEEAPEPTASRNRGPTGLQRRGVDSCRLRRRPGAASGAISTTGSCPKSRGVSRTPDRLLPRWAHASGSTTRPRSTPSSGSVWT